jgi:hypothetical protein
MLDHAVDSGLINFMMRHRYYFLVLASTIVLLGSYAGFAQQSPASTTGASNSPAAVQSIDGGAGPCAVILTVLADTKPVAAADVKVHIEYGFAGIRRLDLEAYSGNDGKVQFTGLPQRVHRPPLTFRASKSDLAGTAVYNPESECKAEHEIVLTRKKQEQN